MFGKIIVIITGLFAAGAILMALAHYVRSVRLGQRIEDWLKYIVYLLVIFALVTIAWAGQWTTAAFLTIVAIAGGYELYRNLPARKVKCLACSIGFALAIGLCLGHILLGTSSGQATTFIFMLLLICTTDAYSQLWGKLLGRRKLCPRLSPGKTFEGLVGGVLTAVLAVFAVSFLVPSFSPSQLIIIAIITALSATLGDLSFSFIKRRLGIKDFSGLLPGHGGVLDRFDSLIITAPVFYWSSRLWLG